MTTLYVWVLLSMHHVHGELIKDYQSTFSTQDRCNAAMQGMNQADPARSWYCERHIVE